MINLIHVGSTKGGMPVPFYRNVVDGLLSFDPLYNRNKRCKLKKIKHKHFQHVVYKDNKIHPFYVLRKGQCSSLYKPNYEFIEKALGGIPGKYKIKRTENMQCYRLDHTLNGIDRDFDFIYSDAQGGDLEVVKSAGKYLSSITGLHLELYLKPFYKDAPLFDEAKMFLEEQGFTFIKSLRNKSLGKERTESKFNFYDEFLFLRYSSLKKDKIKILEELYKV